MAVVHQGVDGHIRTRVVQKRQRLVQCPQAAVGLRVERAQVAGGEGILELSACQPAEYRLAQIGLRQAGHRGVHRRERAG